MNNEQKQQIAEKLQEYAQRYASQNKAANSLKGVSSATVSQVLNGNWSLIKDEMWRNIATQIGFNENQWQVVETRDFKALTHILTDAQYNSMVFGVIGDAGTGKSFCAKHYVQNHKRAYLLSCNEYWNRKYFLAELLRQMGEDHSGLTVAEMMMEVVSKLKKQEQPIIIMDEADKLTDQVLYFFITLYNQLEDHCGIALLATDHLAKRVKKGLRLNKKGYKEIYSRIGRKFIELPGIGSTDVSQICRANGINENKTIKDIFQDSERDLRRVKRKIHATKNMNKQIG
ncbi:MAG: ATP-binding protein [Bacteroidales bacterium]|nr:ATP-binding protein [Bacteroidales bacterium]